MTPLGFTTATTFSEMLEGKTAIRLQDNQFLPEPYYAAILSEEKISTQFNAIGNPANFTKLEQMLLLSAKDTLMQNAEHITDRTGLIVATTKGNIEALGANSLFGENRAYLTELSKLIAQFFGITTKPVVLSNACVSGILAITVAQRMLQHEQYDNFLIVAGDLVTKFTLSGFHSFQALSSLPCKPYSRNRDGITLGDAAAAAWITKTKPPKNGVQVLGGASCNDANHISGPSRTGEGLRKSIQWAMAEAGVDPAEIDFISAHGTATKYNDEMEAHAFAATGFNATPLHSLKGYFGHTLGAAGLLEAVLGIQSMQKNTFIPSMGFDALGVTKRLRIIEAISQKPIHHFLKTASGFGGCNTSVVFKKLS